jgi:hypothetical protein
MAKAPPKSPGTSRVRFIMVEAEMADAGDLSQITQAIQNALRPSTTPIRLTGPAQARPNGAAATAQVAVENEEPEEIEQDAGVGDAEPNRAAASDGPKTPRKFRSPEILDVDLTTEPSFAQFASEKNPGSHTMRFLTVAAWFKLHRGLDAVTADHVYTCYRAVKWPTDYQDFAQPLRDLKRSKLLGLKERGHYVINHIGLQQVEDLSKSS